MRKKKRNTKGHQAAKECKDFFMEMERMIELASYRSSQGRVIDPLVLSTREGRLT
jgi:hypothetical protein